MKRMPLFLFTATAAWSLVGGWTLAEPPATPDEKPTTTPIAEPWSHKAFSPKPIPVLPEPMALNDSLPQPVEFQVTLLSLDWAKLRAKKINLAKTLNEYGATQASESSDHDRILTRVLTADAAAKLIDHLQGANAAKITSRPRIRTISRQPATIHSGGEKPIAVIRQTVNGIRRDHVETLPFGDTVHLTPRFTDSGRLQVRVAAESGRLNVAGRAGDTRTPPEPILRRRVLESTAEVQSGQTIVLAERLPEKEHTDDEADHGMMILVQTTVCKPEPIRPARVVIKTPASKLTAAEFHRLGVDFKVSAAPEQVQKNYRLVGAEPFARTADQGPVLVVRTAETPIQPNPAAADSAHATESPDRLHDAVHDLRSEVRGLQQDVDRLIELLEKREPINTSDVSPRRNAESEQQLAKLRERYNELMNQGRYQDAERVGVEARELDSGIGLTWIWKARFAYRTSINKKAAGGVQTWSDLQSPPVPANSIQQRLGKTISLNVENVPLKDVLVRLSNATGLVMFVDDLGLEEEGVHANVPVSLHVNDVPAATVFGLLLEPRNLAYTIRDGSVLVITSQLRAKGPLLVTTYPVADLVATPNDANLAPRTAADLEGLANLLMAAVEPNDWNHVGGPGTIVPIEKTMSLVIRQTQPAHEKIADLLSRLRRLQDMRVHIETTAVQTPDSFWDELAAEETIKPVFERLAENGRFAVLKDHEAQYLRNQLNAEPCTNLVFHKTTQFNGWPAKFTSCVRDPQSPDGAKTNVAVSLRPTVSSDRRTVRLELHADDLQTPIPAIPDGKTVLVDLTGERSGNAVGTPIVNKLPSPNRVFQRANASKERTLLLVTPRIHIQEEEEELLGISNK